MTRTPTPATPAKPGSRPFDTRPGLADAVKILIQAKRNAGRREVYLKSLEHYLLRFRLALNNAELHEIGPHAIEIYLDKFKGHARATHLNRISTLFSFGVRRGWVPSNPCDRIERLTIDRKIPRILTPDEAGTLRAACTHVMLPYFALAVYAGIRPAEIQRLNWALNIRLPQRIVIVTSGDSKIRRSRVVPLPPVAVKILEAHPLKQGPVAPPYPTIRRWIRKARKLIGGWPADLLRHTAASYLLAQHEDAGKVSTWLGNSPKILLTHYNGLATKEDAERFFAP